MELWRDHSDEVQFYVVYIREAHALDSAAPMGGGSAPLVEDPRTIEERRQVAQVCASKLEMGEIDTLVDGTDDAVSEAYGGWPDRMYLIGKDGKIAYKGGRGPFGFSPDELEEAILKLRP